MRPSRDAPAFKAGAGPFRRTLSTSKHTSRAEAAGLEPARADSQPSDLAGQRPYPPGSASDISTSTCAPVAPRRTCPSPTRRGVWSLVRIFMRNRKVPSNRQDFWRRRRLRTRKQMRMVGVDVRIPGQVIAPCADANQGRMMQTSPGCARVFPGSPGRSHLRDRNNGYVVVTERQKSGSILEPHRFESGPLHGGSRVNSDVGSGRTAPARSDLAQRVRHGI